MVQGPFTECMNQSLICTSKRKKTFLSLCKTTLINVKVPVSVAVTKDAKFVSALDPSSPNGQWWVADEPRPAITG